MTRVLVLSQRIGDPLLPSGGGAHLAATLAGLRAHFEVEAVAAGVNAHAVAGGARALRGLVPGRVRGLRHDLLLAADDRAFARRALELANAFEPDLVYERSEYFARAGSRVGRRRGVPLVLEVNGLFVEDARTMYRSLGEPLGALLERRKHRGAAAVVTVSVGLARRLVERGADPARTFVVPNTIDPARLLPEPRPVDAAGTTIGFVGHLMPWHRRALEILLDVAAGLPEAHVVAVGGGPGLEELRERARRLGIADRVRFSGTLPQEDVPAEVRRFDVGVIPEIFDYAFPVKLVEMGAAGIPVVAPQTADFDEMLAPGIEYEPFAPGDRAGLAAALRRLLDEPERRRQLGAALHAAVRDRFTWKASGAALAGVVERVLAER